MSLIVSLKKGKNHEDLHKILAAGAWPVLARWVEGRRGGVEGREAASPSMVEGPSHSAGSWPAPSREKSSPEPVSKG